MMLHYEEFHKQCRTLHNEEVIDFIAGHDVSLESKRTPGRAEYMKGQWM